MDNKAVFADFDSLFYEKTIERLEKRWNKYITYKKETRSINKIKIGQKNMFLA